MLVLLKDEYGLSRGAAGRRGFLNTGSNKHPDSLHSELGFLSLVLTPSSQPPLPTQCCPTALHHPLSPAPGGSSSSNSHVHMQWRPVGPAPGTHPPQTGGYPRQGLSHPQNLVRRVYTGDICFLRICPIWNRAKRFKITLSRKQFISTELEAILIVLFPYALQKFFSKKQERKVNGIIYDAVIFLRNFT